ncbi:MAG: PQQ-binding-like beta-propeller repeat protein [Thermoguttaceae bacterium]
MSRLSASTIVRISTALMLALGAVFVAGIVAMTVAVLVFGWHPYRFVRMVKRIPQTVSESLASLGPYTLPERKTIAGDGVASTTLLGSWSAFRGDTRNAIYAGTEPLLNVLNTPPPTRWGRALGEGYAGAAVKNGCVYILDYDEATTSDALRSLSRDDGREIWRYTYPVKIKKNHGMSRTIPAVTETNCVAISPKMYVSCVDAKTGAERWFIDLKHDFGAPEPEWYASQCPIIVSDKRIADGRETLILAVGGRDVLMMAIDCETGRELWRTPNPQGWMQTHVSIVPMELDGKATFVYCGKGGVVGVDGASGEMLWSTNDWQIEIATCPSPVVCPDNRVFFCGGYQSGSVMMQIVRSDAAAMPYTAKTLFRLKDATFGAEQQTPILWENHLFGVRQRDKAFVCLTLDGKVVWASNPARFGGGPFVLADGKFWLLDDDGLLTICQATTSAYVPLGSVQVLDDHGCWAPMAVADGELHLRDQKFFKCLDVKSK